MVNDVHKEIIHLYIYKYVIPTILKVVTLFLLITSAFGNFR